MSRVHNECRHTAAIHDELRVERPAIGVLTDRVLQTARPQIFQKNGGDFRQFRMGAGTVGMISVKVSAFSENTAETYGENGRWKGKKRGTLWS